MRNYKRIFVMFGMTVLLFSGVCNASSVEYRLTVDGKQIKTDVQPQLIRNSTYVPVRFFGNGVGASVQFNKPNITIHKGDTTVTCAIGSSVYTRNGEKFSTKEKPYLFQNRVFVPVRIVGELLHCEVNSSVKYSMTDEDKTIHHLELRQTTGKDVTVTAKNLEKEIKVSPDGNWGILTDKIEDTKNNNVYAFYIKNMKTQEIKQVYSSNVFATEDAEWMKDNTVLFGGIDNTNEDYARVLMMYNPKKDKIQELFPASRYRYSMKQHNIIYTHQTENERMRLELGTPYLYDVATKKKTKITPEQYEKWDEEYWQEKSVASNSKK